MSIAVGPPTAEHWDLEDEEALVINALRTAAHEWNPQHWGSALYHTHADDRAEFGRRAAAAEAIADRMETERTL